MQYLRRPHKSAAIVLALVLLLAGLPGLSFGQTEGITVVLDDEGVSGLPEDLATGIVSIAFANDTEETSFFPILARLNEDVTFEALMEGFSQGAEAIIPMVTLLGGTRLEAGAESAITFDLKEGHHVLINFDGAPPQVVPFMAEGEADDAAEAPEADIELALVDFAFGVPLEIEADGPLTLHIENKGMQWHEMVLIKVPDDTTMETLMPVLEQMMAPPEGEAAEEDGPPDIPTDFFWAPIGPGEQAWIDVDLEPGTYVALCFLPDLMDMESGMAHIDKGMVQLFTVVEMGSY